MRFRLGAVPTFRDVLRPMRHPLTKQRLRWQWVVDYYHASLRLWAMAEQLFGKGERQYSWARRMQKLLLLPGGAGRVLHSAAALRARMCSLGMALSDSAAKLRSIVWPDLFGKSIVNRAKTVSTVLMRPKPQLRCMQNPLVVS